MRSADLLGAAGTALLLAACGGSSHSSNPAGTGAADNVVSVSVDGPGCSDGSYFNKPCVSVKVCVPGTTNCQVISDLLLDTGSVGLRVFSQVLTLPLSQLPAPGGGLTECVGYLDGSAQWGPVVDASIVLGNEPAVRVPIQRIDSTYASLPAACSGAQQAPADAGFNGILGVGVWLQDCGPGCEGAGNGVYFSCSGSSCSSTSASLSSQLTNPVAALPQDNNGVVVRLPAVPALGAPSAEGQLVLGIGTRANNTPPGALNVLALDGFGEFVTTQGTHTVSAFVDTGSNGLFFTPPAGASLPSCPVPYDAWFCPASTQTLQASNGGADGSTPEAVSFQIASLDALAADAGVSSAVGGSSIDGSFDWGLPFHLGRDVYIGFESEGSTLGTGPLVAY